jgi:hypothetical protein
MSTGVAGPLRWPWRRWCFLIVLVFALQVSAIYWLGDNTPVRPRQTRPAPTLHLSGNASGELLALSDPTLFALPHRQGFSGEAWLKMPPIPTTSFTWTEPPRWLLVATQELGASLHRVIESYSFDQIQTSSRTEPELVLPKVLAGEPPATRSNFRLRAGLENRRLLTPLDVPVWPNTDLLTNTIVKVLVNAEGIPISAALLSSSGLKAADDYARDLARSARFESVAVSGPQRTDSPIAGLSIGEILFEWRTVPVPSTNSTPLSPKP